MFVWNKFVFLLSTAHQYDKISESGKPEIVEFYKKTKAGVDALDQKVRHYTTYCKTKHWTMAVFYNSLDIALDIPNVLIMHMFYSSYNHHLQVSV